MTDISSVMWGIFAASLVVYIIIIVKRSSEKSADQSRIGMLEKIAQYFSASKSLEKALRQAASEQPDSAYYYKKMVEKIESGADIETAISGTAKEANDPFFSGICDMLAAASRKNDANLLYNSVQKIKEASGLQAKLDSKSEVASWTVQFVFVIIIPLMYYFMAFTLGFETDFYLNGFLSAIVIASALFQGIVLRQWPQSLVKLPLLFSAFYLVYFGMAPALLSGLSGSIIG